MKVEELRERLDRCQNTEGDEVVTCNICNGRGTIASPVHRGFPPRTADQKKIDELWCVLSDVICYLQEQEREEKKR